MVIVTSGKVVMGLDVFSTGDEIDGLTAAEEKKLIALGLAASTAAEPHEQNAPKAKEPTKAELQERCRELGLSDKGTKADLKARIAESEGNADQEPEADTGADADADDEPPTLSAEVPQ
ncbi:MAG: SAP domain-containing protein [Eggerthellaceae bacterium]|nr:SAP domain-containing protein [Eggerthellaceae bacterium]